MICISLARGPPLYDVRDVARDCGGVATMMLQYHFLPQGAFEPCVGAGLNYTRFSNVDLADGAVKTEKDSWGLALQVGFDYRLSKSLYVNFYAKKVQIDSNLYAGGDKLVKLDLDPWLVGVGLGWRFQTKVRIADDQR